MASKKPAATEIELRETHLPHCWSSQACPIRGPIRFERLQDSSKLYVLSVDQLIERSKYGVDLCLLQMAETATTEKLKLARKSRYMTSTSSKWRWCIT